MKIFKLNFSLHGCLLFAYEFISFSHGKVMTWDRYFKKKTVLPDPHGDLSLTIHPGHDDCFDESCGGTHTSH